MSTGHWLLKSVALLICATAAFPRVILAGDTAVWTPNDWDAYYQVSWPGGVSYLPRSESSYFNTPRHQHRSFAAVSTRSWSRGSLIIHAGAESAPVNS